MKAVLVSGRSCISRSSCGGNFEINSESYRTRSTSRVRESKHHGTFQSSTIRRW